jgi:glycosyltransferase involved in cell wall biosynthesis
MRVAIANLTAGGLSGGYLKYLRRLVPQLLQHPDIDQLDVFVPPGVRDQLQNEPWPMYEWAAADIQRGFRSLREAILDRGAEVVFIPTARWLDFGGRPVVVMVRNMEPLEIPLDGNPPGEALRNLARRAVARRACRRATRVIAVSDHVRKYLTSRWRIPTERVAVIQHGADVVDRAPAPRVPAALQQTADEPFVFTAGSIRPARGLVDLVDSLAYLVDKGLPTRAVVAGQVDTAMMGHFRWLNRRAATLRVADRIIWAGGLDEAEMRWCYENCTSFVMTSRAEACPNVALEAMGYACACVSVDRAPMPEFFGPAARYYRVGDGPGLARALMPCVALSQNVRVLRVAASVRAGAFTWETTAERTVAELRTAARS